MSETYAGFYKARAIRVEGEDGNPMVRWGYSPEKGTKQSLIYLVPLEGPLEGRPLPWFGYFTESSWKRTVESYRYLGHKGDDLPGPDADLDQIVQVEIEDEDQFDEHGNVTGSRPRIAWVNRPHRAMSMSRPMSKDDFSKFAAQMRNRLAQVKEVDGDKWVPPATNASKAQGGGAAPANFDHAFAPGGPADQGWGGGDPDDDIPF